MVLELVDPLGESSYLRFTHDPDDDEGLSQLEDLEQRLMKIIDEQSVSFRNRIEGCLSCLLLHVCQVTEVLQHGQQNVQRSVARIKCLKCGHILSIEEMQQLTADARRCPAYVFRAC
jgi:hypothetical protein